MNKNLLFFIYFVFFSISFIKANTIKDFKVYNNIILQNNDVKNIKLLNTNFKSIYDKNLNKDVIDVIYLTMYANVISKHQDKINNQSTNLYNKALSIANKSALDDLILYANTEFGFYYYSYSDYINALPYFINSSKIIDEKDHYEFLNSPEILKKNSYFFGTVEDNEKSIKYLEYAVKNTSKTSKTYPTILNGIAQYHLKFKNYKKAIEYLNQTIYYAKKNNHQIRYAKALGDIALVYKSQKKYDLALHYLEKDIQISKALNEDRNTLYAQILLSSIYFEQENYSLSKEVIIEAENITKGKSHLNSFLNDIYTILLNISIAKHDDYNELLYRRKLNDLQQLLKNTDSEDVIKNINLQLQKENIKYKLEAEINDRNKENFKNRAMYIILVLLISFLLVIILYYKKRFKEQASNYNNKVLKLQLDKITSEKILLEQSNSLETHKTYLIDKNIQIKKLIDEIKEIKDSKISYLEEQNGELQKLLQSHLMTEENWTNFKKVFIEEQGDYYALLIENLPGLTDSNLRIIFLLKMELNNTQIAQLLGITIEAVKKSKQRLKKKYPDNYTLFIHKKEKAQQ